MRRTFSIIAMAAVVLLCACEGDNFSYLPPSSGLSLVYRGDLGATSPADFYMQDNSLLEISLPVNRDTLYTFIFHKAKFSEFMPPVNLKISGIKYRLDGETSVFAADGVVPTVNSVKHPEYTVTGLNGTVYNGMASINMKCGDVDVSYSGIQVTE